MMTMGVNMANKNKKIKEPVYRAPDGVRWRFISSDKRYKPENELWLMVRIRDGYRSYWPPDKLKLEKPNDKRI